MKNTVAILIAAGLLGSVTSGAQMNPHTMGMTHAIQNAKIRTDHEVLARHYEEAAKEAQEKTQEQKEMLQEYESNISHFGRQAALDLQAHCRNLISTYEQAVKANMYMADTHRKMAAEIK